jgi:hypothetical protein
MAQGAPVLGWGLRHFRDEVRFGDFLMHLFACARDPARSLLAAHHATSCRTDGDAGEGFLDERRYRQAELSIVDTLAGGRHPSGQDPLPASGRPQARGGFDSTHDLANLIANAEAVGIAVTWCEVDVRIGGFVYRPAERTARRRDPRAGPRDLDARSLPTVTIGDLVVVLNPTQDWIDTFELVLHELAHALLGHLGPRPSVRQAPRMIAIRERPSWDAGEFEAESAACLVTARRGGRPRRQPLTLMTHFAHLRRDGALASVDLLEVFRVAELLAAWCRLRPHSVTVLAPRGPRPVGPALGRVGRGDDREAVRGQLLVEVGER